MFRKLFSIFLSLFILGSVPGFKVFVHYCHGHASEISFSEADPCDFVEDDDCCKPIKFDDCCLDNKIATQHECEFIHEDCCDTQIVQYEGNKIVSYRPSTHIQPLSFDFTIYIVQNQSSIYTNNTYSSFILNKESPQNLTGRDICIDNCTFII